MRKNHMSKIQQQSRRVKILFQLFFILTPILVCFFWLTVETPYDFLRHTGIVQTSFNINQLTETPLTLTTRLFAILTSLIYCSIIMYALKILIQLFGNYENKHIFTLENARCYQKLGYSVFYWVGGSIFYQPLMTLILTFNNPPHHRMIMISFQGIDFLTLLIGTIIVIISWVMKEGYHLADEQNYTI